MRRKFRDFKEKLTSSQRSWNMKESINPFNPYKFRRFLIIEDQYKQVDQEREEWKEKIR